MKKLKWAGVTLGLLFLGAQFVRPEKTNPPAEEARALEALAEIPPPAATAIWRACIDCHTHRTRCPWYSNVAPVSWFVIDHVNHGRSHLNFSDWAQYDHRRAAELLEKTCREVTDGGMPLPSYLLMHRNARLSRDEVKAICEWTEAEAVSFVVCNAIGLETGTAAQDYIQLYEGDAKLLTENLDRIQQTANRILTATAQEPPSPRS